MTDKILERTEVQPPPAHCEYTYTGRFKILRAGCDKREYIPQLAFRFCPFCGRRLTVRYNSGPKVAA